MAEREDMDSEPAGSQWLGLPPADLQWTETPYGHTAIAWGDPEMGPYGAFNRFRAGTVTPPHTHSHDNQLIVVSGILHNYRLDDPPNVRAAAYPPGSFLYEAGQTPHVTAVDPSAECIVYVSQNAALDFTMIDQPDPGWH